MSLSVSVIVPCYNEFERIASTIAMLHQYLSDQDRPFEIIAVDDGSTDGTMSELQRIKQTHQELSVVSNGVNRGKGYSVKHGVQYASNDVVLFTDADLSTPAEEIGKALAILESSDADIIVGSRTAPGANIEIRQPVYRVVMGRVFAFVVHILLGLNALSDTQCGFKVFRTQVAKTVFEKQTLDRFAFDVEILYIGQQLGYRIHEMPVTWRNRPASKVSPIKDSVQMFRDVLIVRSRHKALRRHALKG